MNWHQSQKRQIIGQCVDAEGSYECCTLQINGKKMLNRLKLIIFIFMAENLKLRTKSYL